MKCWSLAAGKTANYRLGQPEQLLSSIGPARFLCQLANSPLWAARGRDRRVWRGLTWAEANLDARGRDVEPFADGLQISFFLRPALQKCSLPIPWIKAPEGFPLEVGKR
jgi:hypothetical protein